MAYTVLRRYAALKLAPYDLQARLKGQARMGRLDYWDTDLSEADARRVFNCARPDKTQLHNDNVYVILENRP